LNPKWYFITTYCIA